MALSQSVRAKFTSYGKNTDYCFYSNLLAPLNNQLPVIREEQQERTFEPPPPYTPVRSVNKCKPAQHIRNPVIPNEPPPPYEVQRNLRATTV